MASKTKIQSIIDENPVAVFSKSYCPYCRQAKQLLSDSGAKFYAIELDQIGAFCYPSSKNPLSTVSLFVMLKHAIHRVWKNQADIGIFCDR